SYFFLNYEVYTNCRVDYSPRKLQWYTGSYSQARATGAFPPETSLCMCRYCTACGAARGLPSPTALSGAERGGNEGTVQCLSTHAYSY
ncbi:Meiotically up-regulated gene 97 protein, partial [Frankliniella fusca]